MSGLHVDLIVCQMETTIKQAEEDKAKSLESSKHLYEDLRPLKHQVDMLRNSVGLEKLPDLRDEEDRLQLE